MKNILLFIFSLITTYSCKFNSKQESENDTHKQFDKSAWLTKENDDYPFRDQMLDDIVQHIPLKGLKYTALLNVLGEPDRMDNGHLFYRIYQKRIGSFPISTKTLVIKLSKDSIVEWRKIHGG